MSRQQCTFTTQGNLVCGDNDNKSNDTYISTQFRGGRGDNHVQTEHFANGGSGLVLNQLNSAFKGVGPVASLSPIEGFSPAPLKHDSVDVAIDLNGTYGLPWAPY